MRRTIASSASLAALLLATTLSGCSVDIVDPTRPSAESAPAPQTPASPAGPSSQPDPSVAPEHSATPDAATDSTLSVEGQAERARLTEAATTTMPCPSRPLTADGAVIRVEGSCAELMIEIDAGVVIADDIDALTLSGSGTVVYVREVGEITITGSASAIYWEGAAPRIDDRGTANTLTRG